MDTVVDLQKRHGHHHSKVHVNTANVFVLVFLAAMLLYSGIEAGEAINVKRYKRPTGVSRVLNSPIFLTILWLLLCSGGVFYKFKSDIKQIARRYGQLALATSTITVFLAFKPAFFPYTHYVRLVSLHKWVGRTSVLCALIHGVIYFFSYALKSHKSHEHEHEHSSEHESAGHEKRHGDGNGKGLLDLMNIFGMICVVAYIVIFSTSLGSFRRRAYRIFYALHRPLVILIYVLMIWHAHPSSWMIVPAGLVILGAQIIVNVFFHKTIHISKVESFGPTLKLVTFDFKIPEEAKCPASHVRISTPFSNPVTFFRPSHPYTLVGNNQLIVRESRFKLTEGSKFTLLGPYKTSFDATLYSHLLVFAGGSGVSLFPSLNNAVPSQKFVWITRSSQEVGVLDAIKLKECDVYISNTSPQPRSKNEDYYELEQFEINSDSEDNVDEEQTIGGGSEQSETWKTVGDIKQFQGRPEFNAVADSFFNESAQANGKLLVVACGPQSLVDAVTNWASAQKYDTWTEVFAL